MTTTTPPGRPAYNFRIFPELGFAIFVAVLIALGELLLGLDETIWNDAAAWGRLAVGALARAIGGAILTVLTKGAFLGPGETPVRPTSG